VRVLATGQLNTYDVLASEHIVFTEAALSAFTGQPVSPTTDKAEAPKRRATKPKPKAEATDTDTDTDTGEPAGKSAAQPADEAEPRAPRRRATPKEGEEQ
jgi:large subunit ribosomal protein L4